MGWWAAALSEGRHNLPVGLLPLLLEELSAGDCSQFLIPCHCEGSSFFHLWWELVRCCHSQLHIHATVVPVHLWIRRSPSSRIWRMDKVSRSSWKQELHGSILQRIKITGAPVFFFCSRPGVFPRSDYGFVPQTKFCLGPIFGLCHFMPFLIPMRCFTN